MSVDDEYRRSRSARLDEILRKLHSEGWSGLEPVERELLHEASRELRSEISPTKGQEGEIGSPTTTP